MMNYMRARAQKPEMDTPDTPIRFIASTEGVKSDGMELKMEDWSLDRFLQHPVILYAHDYAGANLPIGTGVPSFSDRNLMIDVTFDRDDEFAMRVRQKTVKGMMGGSVGWEQVARDGKPKNELLEFSVVPIPLDPAALPQRAQRGLADLGRQLAQLAGDEPWDFWPKEDGAMPIEQRIGKVLSARNLADLQQAISLIETVIERAKKEDKTAETEAEPEPERTVELDGVAKEWAETLTRMGV
jgi:hypothetical protein